jgi:hypothetical protein
MARRVGREIRTYREASANGRQPPYYLYDYPRHIVLEPIAHPSVDQIRALRDIGGGMKATNMLELRTVLIQGGFAAFGEFIEETALELSARLRQAGLPHRIEKAERPCEIVVVRSLAPGQ